MAQPVYQPQGWLGFNSKYNSI